MSKVIMVCASGHVSVEVPGHNSSPRYFNLCEHQIHYWSSRRTIDCADELFPVPEHLLEAALAAIHVGGEAALRALSVSCR